MPEVTEIDGFKNEIILLDLINDDGDYPVNAINKVSDFFYNKYDRMD